MSGPNSVLDKGFLANSEIRQYKFVKLDFTNSNPQEVVVCDTAGERGVGVVQDQALAEDNDVGERVVNVRVMGITFAKAADGTIAQNDRVATNASGEIATAGTGDVPLGLAMNNSSNAGDLVEVLLTPGLPSA
jgi:hypothetical protein